MRPLIIGIGGAHSGVGKTAYASALLRSLKGWGAIKYTRTALYSSIVDEPRILSEEGKDTRKFLDSGAERVLWVRAPGPDLGEVLPMAVERLSDLPGIVVEGNSAIEFLRPDIIIFIFGDVPSVLKETGRGLLGKAHVVIGGEEVPLEMEGAARRFRRSLRDCDAFVAYIREMIDKKEKIKTSLREQAVDGRISCPLARKIARELAVPYRDVGKAANELRIKITDCELGCF